MTRFLLAAILLLAGLCWLPRVHAATVCTASSTNLAFGPVTGASTVDTTATVTINCTTAGLSLLATARVRMCLNIGAGTNGSSQTNPRRMTNGFNDVMQFQIYRDPARSLIWGDSSIPATPTPLLLDLEYSVPVLGGVGGTTATLHGRVPVQAALAAGAFSNPFTGTNTRLDYRYAEATILAPPFPTSCMTGGDGGGSISFPFTANATVPPSCLAYTTTELNFGSVAGNIATNLDQTSTIGLTCANRTPWQLGLDNGLNAIGITRRMRLGATSNYVSYELYRDPGRSQRWGGTLDIDTEQGTGDGSAQAKTVYGRVPAPQTPAAGSYSDTITVTITY